MVGRAPFRARRGCRGRRGVPRRRGLAPSEAMTSTERVCPYCGEPPGPGVFCAACGRNLAAIEQLPTRAEWEADAPVALAPASGPSPPAVPALSPAEATGAFLDAMRAAGNPGTTKLPMPDAPKEGLLRRMPEVEGWVVRPVVWDDRDNPRHHQPGLLLTTGGTYHRIDSQIRGWGQRNFPVFYDTAAADTLDPPDDGRLAADLGAVRREHDAAPG
jgi:hypothetical protein